MVRAPRIRLTRTFHKKKNVAKKSGFIGGMRFQINFVSSRIIEISKKTSERKIIAEPLTILKINIKSNTFVEKL